MLISFDIECMIHEEDENICFDVYEHLGGKMKVDRFELADTVHIDCLSLLVWSSVFNVFRLFRIA